MSENVQIISILGLEVEIHSLRAQKMKFSVIFRHETLYANYHKIILHVNN
jgi:hypothetical protein